MRISNKDAKIIKCSLQCSKQKYRIFKSLTPCDRIAYKLCMYMKQYATTESEI